VVFSSAARADAAKTDPPVMKLSVTPNAVDEPQVPVDVPTQAAGPGSVGQPVIPDTTPQLPDTTVPQVNDPVVQPSTPAVQPVAQPQTITVGYAYPVVWLLPLLFLVVVPLAARALTKDLTPAV
jgi:hypothetical protein